MAMPKIERKGDTLVITLACGAKDIEAAPQSSSGKSKMVGSTGGFIPVDGPGNFKLQVSLISK